MKQKPRFIHVGDACEVQMYAIFPGWDFDTQRHEIARQLRAIADALEGQDDGNAFEHDPGWHWQNWSLKTKRQRTTFSASKSVERKRVE